MPFEHFLSFTERFRCKDNAILLLNMVTVLTTATAEYAQMVLKIFEVSISGDG